MLDHFVLTTAQGWRIQARDSPQIRHDTKVWVLGACDQAETCRTHFIMTRYSWEGLALEDGRSLDYCTWCHRQPCQDDQ